jgi:hypothetical protein
MQFRREFTHVPEEVECLLIVSTTRGRRACLAELHQVLDGPNPQDVRLEWRSTWDGTAIGWPVISWTPVVMPEEDEAVI